MPTSISTKPCVLVVEDDLEYQTFLREALVARGYDVQLASDGLEAFNLARQAPPSVIVSDVVMPRASGYSLLERLRADQSTRNIPVILISGLGERNDIRKGMVLGADDYLTKPFKVDELCSTIETRLQRLAHLTLPEASPDHDRPKDLPHVLRNPLNAILGIANLLRERAEEGTTCPPDELLEDLRNIETSGQQLLRMVERLLFFEELLDIKTSLRTSDPNHHPELAHLTPKPVHLDRETLLSAMGHRLTQANPQIEIVPTCILITPDYFRQALVDLFQDFTEQAGESTELSIYNTVSSKTCHLYVTFKREAGYREKESVPSLKILPTPPDFTIRVLTLILEMSGGSLQQHREGSDSYGIELKLPLFLPNS